MARRSSSAQGRFDLAETESGPDKPSPPARVRNTPPPLPEQPDLFSLPVTQAGPAPDKPAQPAPERIPEPVRFILSPVRLRQFIATAGSNAIDHWLYYCTDDNDDARMVQEQGLTPDRETPPVLREAGAVTAWLAHFDEDGQDETGTGEPVIFRVRRSLVRTAIETDPDASQQPGKRHYLLAGDKQDD
ncbi:hypothetical protein GOB93_01015 [Acetobacter musti]|uniref:Uncharacterized protein n=1 Tax=Acetobacter musti TaxID=864732 RepID=A0ABX0JM98_9PROT|nr:hypothetical protein [Acetobacter musti]NHN83223.1 hypothetical protein [Acetobacter musti]